MGSVWLLSTLEVIAVSWVDYRPLPVSRAGRTGEGTYTFPIEEHLWVFLFTHTKDLQSPQTLEASGVPHLWDPGVLRHPGPPEPSGPRGIRGPTSMGPGHSCPGPPEPSSSGGNRGPTSLGPGCPVCRHPGPPEPLGPGGAGPSETAGSGGKGEIFWRICSISSLTCCCRSLMIPSCRCPALPGWPFYSATFRLVSLHRVKDLTSFFLPGMILTWVLPSFWEDSDILLLQ